MRFFFIAFLALVSLNANAQWDRMNTNTNLKFTAIAFDDLSPLGLMGYALAHDPGGSHPGQAYITYDHGVNWSLQSWNDTSEYWDVTVSPEGWWWFVGEGGYYWCQNLSITAREGRISPYTLYCGDAPTDSSFYAAGEHGMVYRTLDLGATWDTLLNTGTTETINDIYFSNVANGWIVCDDGHMAVTADSGNTWTFVAQPMFGFYNIKSIDYQDTLGVNPYIVGSDGVAYFSINGGVSWAGIATGTVNTLNKIRFGTNNAGLICGDNGFIFRTDNAGWSWFADTSEEHVDLFDIAYAEDTSAFICGDSGVILRSRTNISSVQQHQTSSFAAGAYPNPGNGPLNLQLFLSAESDLTIDVMDLTGQIIHSEYHENVSAGENVKTLSVESPAAGVYFVRVSNGFSAVTLRVIRN